MTTPTPSPSETMRLAEEAHSAMLTFAEEVWQAGIEGFNTSTVAPCREARAKAEAAIDRLRDLAALASTQAATLSPLKREAELVGEIVGTEKRGFALTTIVRWEPGFNRMKIGTLLYAHAASTTPGAAVES